MMKNLFCLTLCCMLTLLANGQQQSLQVDLKLKGIASHAETVLLTYKGNKLDTIARQKMDKAPVVLNAIATAEPGFYFLKVGSQKEVLTLFTGAGKIEIAGDVAAWPKVQVSGSASHKDYEDYHLLTDSLESAGQALSKQYAAMKDSKDTAARSVLEKQLMATIKAYERKQIEFVLARPASYYSAVVVNNARWDWKGKRAAYDKLSATVKSSSYGTVLAKNIIKWKKESGLLEVGDTVPGFTAGSAKGASLSIQEELAGNKLTLIDFWASWCGPCRQESPELIRVYQENKSRGFDIVGFSLDEKADDWKAAIAKDGLVWEQVSDLQGWKSRIADQYLSGRGVKFIPMNYLVDSKGKILALNLRGDKLGEKVRELLNRGNL